MSLPRYFPKRWLPISLSSFHLVSDLRLYPLNYARVRFNKGRSSLWLPISVLSSGDNLHFTVEMTDKSWSNHPRHWRTLKCTTIYAYFFPALTNLRVAVPFPPPPFPQGEAEAMEGLRKPDTNRVPWRHSLARKCIMTFYWLTSFADSFVNSDWLELVIYIHTN